MGIKDVDALVFHATDSKFKHLLLKKAERIEDNKELTEKILQALDKWAIQFKIMGFPHETPRFSQLMCEHDDDQFRLQSTQRSTLIAEIQGLTKEENIFLMRMDHNDRWEQYRALRNKFLAENHPTISLI